jgi:hypothetical protein
MNFKRKKCKRNVKCTLCTSHRWKGNRKGRFKDKEVAQKMGTSGDLQSRCLAGSIPAATAKSTSEPGI